MIEYGQEEYYISISLESTTSIRIPFIDLVRTHRDHARGRPRSLLSVELEDDPYSVVGDWVKAA